MQYLKQAFLIGALSFLLIACSSNKPLPANEYPYKLHYDVAAVSAGEQSPLSSYDPITLWRNWALASCLAKTFNDNEELREDAYRAASGYFNFGSGLDIYSHLSGLAELYLKGQPYHRLEDQKTIKLLKCIDFFHSAELRDMLMLEDKLDRQFKAIKAQQGTIDTSELRKQLSQYDLRQKGLPLTHALYLMEWALDKEQFAVVALLLDLGVNPDNETQSYGSTLDLAFRKDQGLRYLKAMLDGGLSPNHGYPGQEPMLHRAIAGDGVNQVKLLVERGSAINAPNSQGISPLTAAINSGKIDIAIYLVEQGALFNTQTVKTVQSAIEHSGQSFNRPLTELHELMLRKLSKQ